MYAKIYCPLCKKWMGKGKVSVPRDFFSRTDDKTSLHHLPPGWRAGILLLGGVTQSSMSPFFAACDAYSSKWHSYFWLFERSGNCWTVSVLWKTKTAVDFSGTNTVPLYTCMCLQLLMDILMNDLDTKNKGMHFYRPYISQRAMYLLLRDCNR